MTTDQPNPPLIRILTVDDHPLMRFGIESVIRDQADMLVIAEAANGREACDRCLALRPDITLMDIHMPLMNGIDATVAIRAAWPTARIVTLSSSSDDYELRRAIQAGAAAFLLKGTLRRDLLRTIREVHAGAHDVLAQVDAAHIDGLSHTALTRREVEVLRLAAEGSSNKRIAATLGVAEGTIKAHMKVILSKLDARDRTHAVTLALRRGIMEL